MKNRIFWRGAAIVILSIMIDFGIEYYFMGWRYPDMWIVLTLVGAVVAVHLQMANMRQKGSGNLGNPHPLGLPPELRTWYLHILAGIFIALFLSRLELRERNTYALEAYAWLLVATGIIGLASWFGFAEQETFRRPRPSRRVPE